MASMRGAGRAWVVAWAAASLASLAGFGAEACSGSKFTAAVDASTDAQTEAAADSGNGAGDAAALCQPAGFCAATGTCVTSCVKDCSDAGHPMRECGYCVANAPPAFGVCTDKSILCPAIPGYSTCPCNGSIDCHFDLEVCLMGQCLTCGQPGTGGTTCANGNVCDQRGALCPPQDAAVD